MQKIQLKQKTYQDTKNHGYGNESEVLGELDKGFIQLMSHEHFFEKITHESISPSSQIKKNDLVNPRIQPKLFIGQLNDKYEQEADYMADLVVNQISTGQLNVKRKPKIPIIQQKQPGPQHVRTAPPLVAQKLEQKKGQGGLLPSNVQAQMEKGFGEDFSKVRVHKDGEAVQLNQQLGARAFTYGSDVYFNRGEYQPSSKEGQRLLAHELTHVVQQREGLKIQRLIKNNYPWTGVVFNTTLLASREAPNKGTIADLPAGTLVNVVGVSGNWLKIEIDTSQNKAIVLNSKGKKSLSGNILTGYCYHTYIDDAAGSEMSSMVGKKATWVGSGPGSGNTFESWASARSEQAAPSLREVSTINCWEMVLLAAYRIGAINWSWIHNLYTNTTGNWYDKLPGRLTSGSLKSYDLATKKPSLQRGDLVFFDGAAHVALATGNGDEILTFWPPPNTPFNVGARNYATVDIVKTSTISALSGWMTTNFGSTPIVTFGSPNW